ncbi:MAG: hypothetical protein VR64_20810 [Desulfatitalea sp. BRH_c12]|nr:MAG: hypothetical protein VR64_20810 [Desulfatitalea sp. BRH_c12]
MTYISDLKRIMQLDDQVYEDLAQRNRLLHYSTLHVILLGLLYGVTAVLLSRRLLSFQGADSAGDFNALFLIMMGVAVAFLVHGGAALFTWVFCRGIGGSPLFMPLYLSSGVAAAAAWPLAPLVVLMQSGAHNYLIYAIGLALSVFLFAVEFVAVRKATGLNKLRMTIAAVATFIYMGCFLYLWL